MKAIKINNFPESLVLVFVENNITFAYNWGKRNCYGYKQHRET